jgi:hypothetical protein
MKNPFEKPQPEMPANDESVDLTGQIDELIEEELGTFTDASLKDRHERLAKELAPERAQAEGEIEAVAAKFVKDYPLFEKRFGRDPEALRRFRNGLPQLIRMKGTAYGYRDEATHRIDVPGLLQDRRFAADLSAYSVQFEDEENRRRAA